MVINLSSWIIITVSNIWFINNWFSILSLGLLIIPQFWLKYPWVCMITLWGGVEYVHVHAFVDRSGKTGYRSPYTAVPLYRVSTALWLISSQYIQGEGGERWTCYTFTLHWKTDSLSLSLSLQAIIVILTHCKCTLFFVVVRMQWDFWFSFGFFLGEFAISLSIWRFSNLVAVKSQDTVINKPVLLSASKT